MPGVELLLVLKMQAPSFLWARYDEGSDGMSLISSRVQHHNARMSTPSTCVHRSTLAPTVEVKLSNTKKQSKCDDVEEFSARGLVEHFVLCDDGDVAEENVEAVGEDGEMLHQIYHADWHKTRLVSVGSPHAKEQECAETHYRVRLQSLASRVDSIEAKLELQSVMLQDQAAQIGNMMVAKHGQQALHHVNQITADTQKIMQGIAYSDMEGFQAGLLNLGAVLHTPLRADRVGVSRHDPVITDKIEFSALNFDPAVVSTDDNNSPHEFDGALQSYLPLESNPSNSTFFFDLDVDSEEYMEELDNTERMQELDNEEYVEELDNTEHSSANNALTCTNGNNGEKSDVNVGSDKSTNVISSCKKSARSMSIGRLAFYILRLFLYACTMGGQLKQKRASKLLAVLAMKMRMAGLTLR